MRLEGALPLNTHLLVKVVAFVLVAHDVKVPPGLREDKGTDGDDSGALNEPSGILVFGAQGRCS